MIILNSVKTPTMAMYRWQAFKSGFLNNIPDLSFQSFEVLLNHVNDITLHNIYLLVN